ncbi:hypothetical protein MLD38_028886 [Melastoma candidum]|uniref:Uncharacterized protein n=1 Tax=Melastoma candidum TaxID=119954 RepID=A0ACB9N206_9MYRT|nr:hypothetical protein MLD38_028886 [Melastoma candidum]
MADSNGPVGVEEGRRVSGRTNPMDGFYDYLRGVDCSDVEIYAIPEGAMVFTRVPLMRVEGPIAVNFAQLLKTPILNLVNYGIIGDHKCFQAYIRGWKI